MKQLALILLSFYQRILSPLLHQVFGVQSACRYFVTCSEYGKQMIMKHGALGGGKMAVKRVISCQPF